MAEAPVTISLDPAAARIGATRWVTLLAVAALIVLPWLEADRFVLHVLSLIAIASIVAFKWPSITCGLVAAARRVVTIMFCGRVTPADFRL